MKTLILISTFFLSSGFCGTSYSTEISSSFNYEGKQYKSVLPIVKIENSKNFEINDTQKKIDIAKIVKTAKEVLSKVDQDADWNVESIGLYKYQYSQETYWYYQINLRSGSSSYVYLNVGLSGEKPEIYRIDEILLK